MFKILSTPLLLRRLVRAQERQASALEKIARAVLNQSGGLGEVVEEYSLDDDDLTYSTDERSWAYRERDKTRLTRPREEDIE